MSAREVKVPIIDCDSCTRVYADSVVFLSLAALEEAAEQDGWEFRGSEALCPRCKAMRECQEEAAGLTPRCLKGVPS